jgi:hypothetical protein
MSFSDEEFDEMWLKWDTEGNGEIDYSEFALAWTWTMSQQWYIEWAASADGTYGPEKKWDDDKKPKAEEQKAGPADIAG